jgi:acetylornithine deacetylase/succinyl-diaminopimelate desuccinylase-like protein
MVLDDLYDCLERDRADCLQALFALARKPSISSDDTAVRECAALLLAMLKQAGLDAALCETGGRPLICAHCMAASRPDLPVVRQLAAAVRRAYGMEPLIQPCMGASLPDSVWTQTLGVPSVLVPYANADQNNHAPNENLRLDNFYAGIRCTLSVLESFGHEDGVA